VRARVHTLSLHWVMLLNALIIAACIFFAVFMPTVGVIIRYVWEGIYVKLIRRYRRCSFAGSISGLMYLFALPCAVHLKRLQRENKLTVTQLVLHGIIVLLGVANLVAQFVIL
jgi:sodium-coupled neutral amino acid transporter 9